MALPCGDKFRKKLVCSVINQVRLTHLNCSTSSIINSVGFVLSTFELSIRDFSCLISNIFLMNHAMKNK
ncbi:hypothetical protein BpHYR1_045107 [Brachionus plicatilis]|uniref:Uncharacterized protein n=1 Tax=Brachionus plicatilis TaxID=10195 RepID=A0A3M7QYS8_BRAPC|nr:hypothetical protein BpHYR1_045107 [Brachionus plicatilis]